VADGEPADEGGRDADHRVRVRNRWPARSHPPSAPAAHRLADEAGLGAVTMAAVARRCGFTTMSLYRHVSGKDELVRRMLDSGLGTAPPVPSGDWRAGLAAWARALLAVLERHPWAIDVPITGILGTHAQLSWLDRGLEALAGTGLDYDEQASLVLLLNGYVFWAARLRLSVPPAAVEVIPTAFGLDAYPFVARAAAAGTFGDGEGADDEFEYGLARVLDGAAARIAGP
jgi:AcrR family transcriptional regulator